MIAGQRKVLSMDEIPELPHEPLDTSPSWLGQEVWRQSDKEPIQDVVQLVILGSGLHQAQNAQDRGEGHTNALDIPILCDRESLPALQTEDLETQQNSSD